MAGSGGRPSYLCILSSRGGVWRRNSWRDGWREKETGVLSFKLWRLCDPVSHLLLDIMA
jgi:hypothetical protein